MKVFILQWFSKPAQAMLAAAVLAAFAFAAGAKMAPRRVNVSLAFTIAQQARQETSDYSYDGYYALRASELVTDTMLSWLATPSIVKEIYAEAGLPITDARIASIAGRMFRGKKFSSQNLAVSYSAPDQATAERLYRALARALPNRARELVLSPKQNSLFLVTASDPVIAEGGVSPVRAALAGAFIGAFIGLACAYTLRKKQPSA